MRRFSACREDRGHVASHRLSSVLQQLDFVSYVMMDG